MSLISVVKKAVIVLILIGLVLLLTMIRFDIVSQGEGVLAINDSNVNILSPSSGIIREIYVTRGDDVHVGAPLLLIGNIEDENKRELLEFNSTFYAKQLQLLKKELKILKLILQVGQVTASDRENVPDSIKVLKVSNKYNSYTQQKSDLEDKQAMAVQKRTSLSQQEKILQNKSNMIREALGDTVRYLDSQLEVERVRLQLVESDLLLEEAKSQVEIAYLDFIQLILDLTDQAENEFEKNTEMLQAARSELNTVSERIESTEINSTVNGTVLSITDGLAKGVFIERNAQIMTLKRADEGVYIDARFDSKFRPYLAVGEVAKVKFNAPGIKDYFYGWIDNISMDSFEYEEYSRQGSRYYNVKVMFDRDEELPRLSTLLGLKTAVYVVNDQMTFLEYIVSTFNKDLDFSVW